jgi:hypothetical protein
MYRRDVRNFFRHLCELVLRHKMWVSNYFVSSFYSAYIASGKLRLIKMVCEVDSIFKQGDFIGIFFLSILYSALLHLPPLRFYCVNGCWDRTQDRCNWCIGSQML